MSDNTQNIESKTEDSPVSTMLAEKFLSDHATLDKYKYMVDSSFHGQALSNRVGKLIYANKFYLEMVGVDNQEEVLGDEWQKIISDTDRYRVIEGWTKYLVNKVQKFWAIVEYKNLKSGEVFKKKVICSKIQDNGYGINIVPVDYEVPHEFVEAVFP